MDLLQTLLSNLNGISNRMAGLTLPPEQRSIMPGVNALQDRQRLLSGGKPYVDQDLVTELMSGMPLVAGVLHKGGKYFHGTPYVYDKAQKSRDGLAGPGHYVTNNAEVASDYAHGSTFPGGGDALQEHMKTQTQAEKSWKDRIAQLLAQGKVDEADDTLKRWKQILQYTGDKPVGPKTRPYQVKPHDTYPMDKPLVQED